MPSLIRKTLRDSRRMLIGWLVGVTVWASLYTSFYGRFAELGEAKLAAIPKAMREAFGWQEVASGAGYLETTVYGVIGPLLLILFATTLGARGVAGPEEAGVLDLYLANPISRRRFVAARFLSFSSGVVAVGAVPWIVVTIYDPMLGMGVGAANVAAASLGLMLVAYGFGALSFAVGAATGRRSVALAVTGGAAVGTYLARAMADLVDGLGPLRWLSPFQYYLGGDPLRQGFHAGYLLALVAVVAVAYAVAVVTFDRRDVGV